LFRNDKVLLLSLQEVWVELDKLREVHANAIADAEDSIKVNNPAA